jgi:uncharacterized membrane protein (UPF0127 family)
MTKMIKNTTKKTIIAKNSTFIDDIFSKCIGLMFSKKQNKALILKFNKEKIIALHMFFVFYPIDVLFVGKNNIVMDKKENFKPFTFYKSRKKAMYAIELPDGIIKRTKTNIGDKIEF